MTTIFATESTTSLVSGAFGTLVRGFHVMQYRRAQRLAMRALMEMAPGHLDDLGIDIQDLHDAFAAPPSGQRLAQRRQARSMNWTPNPAAAG